MPNAAKRRPTCCTGLDGGHGVVLGSRVDIVGRTNVGGGYVLRKVVRVTTRSTHFSCV